MSTTLDLFLKQVEDTNNCAEPVELIAQGNDPEFGYHAALVKVPPSISGTCKIALYVVYIKTTSGWDCIGSTRTIDGLPAEWKTAFHLQSEL